MSKPLFDASDDEANDLQLGTNQDYAKSYNSFRKKELLKKYKDRGLDVSESEFDSSSESSEEDEVVDPKFDQEFFKTLASLKSKDPTIYDKNKRFFEDLTVSSDDENKPKQEKKSKPVTLKDYERKVILERNGKFEDDSDVETAEFEERAPSPTAVEEERRLKAEFKKVMANDDSEEEEFGGIFKKRTKTKAEQAQEDQDFATWLAGKQANIEQTAQKQLEPLKNYWSSSKLPQSERFLRDYILNKGYANTKVAEIPTYDEIVGDNAPLSEDEAELEKQAEFEQKYNFRFEEPDAEFIKRYPRTIESSLRQTDDKRKQKRNELKERKEQEKKQKMKEIEMIKEMKRKEIEDKIRKLKAVTGNDELGFKDEELEEDFDPEAHDRRMQEIFNDEYYEVDEGEEKPECPSDIDELQIEDWDNYDPRRGGAGEDEDDVPHCEDDDFIMDCDYDPAAEKQKLQQELIENTKGKRSRKGRRNRFMEIIQAEKPAFNPEDEKTYGEYIDEYYKLDCEDIIGDLPCRFKYVETTPNDFGLSIEEILLAKNKELNQWASLKKAVQIRPEYVDKKEQRLYKMKAKNEELKRKIFKSLYGEGSDDEENEQTTAEVQNTTTNTPPATTSQTLENTETTPAIPLSKSKRKRLRRKAAAAATAKTLPVGEASENEQHTPSKKAKLDVVVTKKAADVVDDVKIENVDTEKLENKKNIIKTEKTAKTSNTTKPAPPTTTAATPNKTQNNNTEKSNPFKQKSLETVPTGNKFKANPNPKRLETGNKFKTNPNPKRLETGNKFKTKPNGKFQTKKPHNGHKQKSKDATDAAISDERLKAYGINPRKFHKKQKFGNKAKQQK